MAQPDPLPRPSATPRFEHECENCVFLGQQQESDVYACRQGGWPTLVLRYGDKGWEYHSGSYLAERLRSPVREAAVARMQEWSHA